jgi:hypothetical protein
LVDRLFWDRETAPAADAPAALLRVMELGDWATIRAMEREVPRERLATVLREAPVGALGRRSRRFWQVRLGLACLPEPQRLPGVPHHALPFGDPR